MKQLPFLALSAFLFSAILSCKKSSSGNTTPTTSHKTESVSFKITLNPVIGTSQGGFSGSCNALLPNGGYAIWKVNGATRSGETTIAFTQTDFQNGLLTLETTSVVTTANLDISGVTTAQFPFTATVVPTINGVVTDSTAIPVTSTMQRNWSF